MKCLARALLLVSLAWLGGCEAPPAPAQISVSELAHLKSFFVAKREGDTHGVDQVIADQLGLLGYAVKTGDLAAAGDAEAVVTYDASYAPDGAMYLLELRIELRQPGRKPETFVTRSYLERKKPPEMAHELIEFLLNRPMSPFGK